MSAPSPISLLGLKPGEIRKKLRSLVEPSYRIDQILKWMYEGGVQSFEEMTNLPLDLRDALKAQASILVPEVDVLESRDGTRKYQFKLGDGALIESVWMPEVKRNTLCISSQVGCPLKCAFCVTGAVGYQRNLDVDEIISQVRHVKCTLALPVSNVVLMGMGEPLLNEENVAQAIEILTDEDAYGIGRRKITVSTAGIAPKIVPFFERTGVKIAISLTGASDKSRDHWMPINRKHKLSELKTELLRLKLRPGQKITFEVALIADKTDSREQCEALGRFLERIPAHVNLIPYNENPYFPSLRAPTPERVDRFMKALLSQGIPTTVRRNRGQDIMAACGQLAGTSQKLDMPRKEDQPCQ